MEVSIKCICGRGTLGLIARTEPSYSSNNDKYTSSFFFACNHCKRIYHSLGGEGKNSYSLENIWQYKGELSREQIKKYVPREMGFLSSALEGEILKAIRMEFAAEVVDVNGEACIKGLPVSLIGKKVTIIIYE